MICPHPFRLTFRVLCYSVTSWKPDRMTYEASCESPRDPWHSIKQSVPSARSARGSGSAVDFLDAVMDAVQSGAASVSKYGWPIVRK